MIHEVPESVSARSPGSEHNHAGYGAHQQIMKIDLGDRAMVLLVVLVVMALGIGASFAYAIHTGNEALIAEREARLAQAHIDELHKIVDGLQAKVNAEEGPKTLILKEQCNERSR